MPTWPMSPGCSLSNLAVAYILRTAVGVTRYGDYLKPPKAELGDYVKQTNAQGHCMDVVLPVRSPRPGGAGCPAAVGRPSDPGIERQTGEVLGDLGFARRA